MIDGQDGVGNPVVGGLLSGAERRELESLVGAGGPGRVWRCGRASCLRRRRAFENKALVERIAWARLRTRKAKRRQAASCQLPGTPSTRCNRGLERSLHGARRGNAVLAAQAVEHDLDLFFRRIPLTRRPKAAKGNPSSAFECPQTLTDTGILL